ncbi:homeobox-leucine zipper protein HOX3 [Impatiens glandulifera]|uniref:homeobox-leucine zipper protein HOX3 n=1 Tax=Impatiens glandulifera TaxID=253017 RepID=UPI001FB0D272|nr:homeobox-leucine zipper protein HOX3 [Impatiens glandulifera]
MATTFPTTLYPSSLELTISMPGFASSSSTAVRDFDINQVPSGGEEHREYSVDDDDESNGPMRKKLRLSKEQTHILEDSFRQNQTLNPKQKESLALKLKLKPRQVEVWFQNRRARSKLKQTEMECVYLKRWFGSLTEQNKRLQKEVEELRALRAVGPSNGREPMLTATLSMCPRCERVTTTTSSVTPVPVDRGNGVHFTTTAKVPPRFPTQHPSAAC